MTSPARLPWFGSYFAKPFVQHDFMQFLQYMTDYLRVTKDAAHPSSADRYVDLVFYELSEILTWMDLHSPHVSAAATEKIPHLLEYFARRNMKYCQIEGHAAPASASTVCNEFTTTWALFVSSVNSKELFQSLGATFLDWIGRVAGFAVDIHEKKLYFTPILSEAAVREKLLDQTCLTQELVRLDAEMSRLKEIHARHTHSMIDFIKVKRAMPIDAQPGIERMIGEQASILSSIYGLIQDSDQKIRKIIGVLGRFNEAMCSHIDVSVHANANANADGRTEAEEKLKPTTERESIHGEIPSDGSTDSSSARYSLTIHSLDDGPSSPFNHSKKFDEVEDASDRE